MKRGGKSKAAGCLVALTMCGRERITLSHTAKRYEPLGVPLAGLSHRLEPLSRVDVRSVRPHQTASTLTKRSGRRESAVSASVTNWYFRRSHRATRPRNRDRGFTPAPASGSRRCRIHVSLPVIILQRSRAGCSIAG